MKLNQYNVTTFRKNNNHIIIFDNNDNPPVFAISFDVHQALLIVRELVNAANIRKRIDDVIWSNNDVQYKLSICITDRQRKLYGLNITSIDKDLNEQMLNVFFDGTQLKQLIDLFGKAMNETY